MSSRKVENPRTSRKPGRQSLPATDPASPGRRRRFLRDTAALSLLLLALFAFSRPAPAREPGRARAVDYARDVYPVLRKACFECHGSGKQKGGLRLDSLADALKGGKRGPVIVPGRAAASTLYRRVTRPRGDEDVMPPRGEPLGKARADLLRDWIDQGAKGWGGVAARHWAYVKGGITHGKTDDFGFSPVENPVHVHDLNATVLRLLGLDHEKLTFKYRGRDFRLTDVYGRVVRELIA